jgi:archaellum component FlaG (FlaF/FlaG flagellin family)
MRVTNPGDVALDHVTVSDPGCDAAPHGNGDGTLSPGERWIYQCRHVIRADAPGWFATTATVRATSAGGSAHASARSATRVLRPKLTISVSPDPASGSPGDSVTYTYLVRNTGDATLTNLTVTDDQLGAVGTVPQLAPGHSITLTMTRTLSAKHVWVTNTGTVTGSDPSGDHVTASDQASVTIVAPASDPGGSGGNGDGTAFTGGDATLPGLAAVLLAIVGAGSLVAASRRRS